MITADSWLNTSYGVHLKLVLKRDFRIHSLVSLEERVFVDAQVKPVLLLATKALSDRDKGSVYFIRVQDRLSTNRIAEVLAKPESGSEIASVTKVENDRLIEDQPWSVFFRAPTLYAQLTSHPLLAPVKSLAKTSIGLQTLAKDFFVMTPAQALATGIEERFLRPLILSPRYWKTPIVDLHAEVPHLLFYCKQSKNELRGTKALAYIEHGESQKVQVRGRQDWVIGYHNKERIARSGREQWYDLRTSIERRGCASILIPRLIYRDFSVLWNKANFVPGELFIEFSPKSLQHDLESYLAALNSSVFEVMLRHHAQLYGGGTYNMNPGKIGEVPMLDVTVLTQSQRHHLAEAYRQSLLQTSLTGRYTIDKAVLQILGLPQTFLAHLSEVNDDLVRSATHSKKSPEVQKIE